MLAFRQFARLTRFFGVKQAPAEPVQQQTQAPKAPQEPFNIFEYTNSLRVNGNVPQRSWSDLPERLEEVLNEAKFSIHTIPGTRGYFYNLTVYTFGEFVKLEDAAIIKRKPNNELEVVSLDPLNAGIIEDALLNSGFEVETQRNFEVINLKLKKQIDLDSSVAKIKEAASAKVKEIQAEGNKRLSNDPNFQSLVGSVLDKISKLRVY